MLINAVGLSLKHSGLKVDKFGKGKLCVQWIGRLTLIVSVFRSH